MFSFLFAGGSKEDQERLDKLVKALDDCPGDGSKADLEALGRCARELREVMDSEVARGARNNKLLQRIDGLSNAILEQLEGRLTVDLLRHRFSKAAVGKLMSAAKDLDAVRATKASTILEGQLDELEEQVAKDELQKLAEAMEQLQDVPPARMARAMQRTLGSLEAAHANALSNHKLKDLLLKDCVALANCLLDGLPAALPAEAQAAAQGRAAARRLDGLGRKLARSLAASWDPLVLPRVDALVQEVAGQAFSDLLGAIEAELAKDDDPDLDTVNQSLLALHPWWPHTAEVNGTSEQVQAIVESVEARVEELFKAATSSDETSKAEEFLTFAEEYDVACAAFQGIPAAESSLQAKLTAAVSSGASKRLDALDRELARSPGLQRSTAVMATRLLEGLLPLWAAAAEADDSLRERLVASLAALEDRAEVAASTETSSVALDLLHFAEKYDKLREQLCQGEDADRAGLRARLAPPAAEACLRAAEEEAAKAEELSPQIVLQALEPLQKEALAEAVGDEDARQRLASCLQASEERVRQGFVVASAEGDEQRLEGLRDFAAKLDTFREDVEPAGRGEGRQLQQWLELLSALDAAEAEFVQGAELDYSAAATALAALASLCDTPVDAEDVSTRLQGLVESLRVSLPAQLSTATADAAEAIVRCGGEADVLAAAIGSNMDEDGSKLCDLLATVQHMAEQLDILDVELAKESGMNPNTVLEALEAVKAGWEPVAHVYELGKRLQGAFSVMEGRMAESCEQAVAKEDTKKVTSLLSFARRCDQVREAASGDAQLCERLAVVVIGARLDVAKAELEKETATNPIIVLGCLKTIAALWPDVQEREALSERIAEVGSLMATRMLSSMDEAARDGNRRKAGALVGFAKEYDTVFEVVGAQVGLCEGLAKCMLRAASGAGLEDVESSEPTEAIMEAFRRWDVDGNGTIEREEFETLLKKLDPRFTTEVVERLFEEADTKRNGVIEYEEFVDWLFR